MKLNALPITFLLLPAIAACVVDDPDLASDQLDITNAAETRVHEETVFLDFNPGSWCTGLAITPHWVLTAAHCVDHFAQNVRIAGAVEVWSTNNSYDQVQIYGLGGNPSDAMIIRHPNFTPNSNDRQDDVALIKLYGRGMTDGDTIDPFSARIYWSSSEPWKSNYNGTDRDFHVAGYGFGGPAGDASTCDDEQDGQVKRLGRFELDPSISHFSSSYTAKAETPYDQDICNGDSGAPYLLNRSGWYSFAIHSGSGPTPEEGGQEFGTLIRPKMSWIESTAAARGPALSCANYLWSGTTYRQCSE